MGEKVQIHDTAYPALFSGTALAHAVRPLARQEADIHSGIRLDLFLWPGPIIQVFDLIYALFIIAPLALKREITPALQEAGSKQIKHGLIILIARARGCGTNSKPASLAVGDDWRSRLCLQRAHHSVLCLVAQRVHACMIAARCPIACIG